MNDRRHDHHDFELASAVLDGHASESERATVAADPALSALVDQLRQLRSSLHADAAVTPAGAGHDAVRDLAIDEALRVFDRGTASTPPSVADGAEVTSIIDRIARRRPAWLQQRTGIAAIAAGLLVAVVGVPALMSAMGGSNDESSEIATQSADAGATPVGDARISSEPTIASIIGPASVPIEVVDADGLLEVAAAIAGPSWSTPGDGTFMADASIDLFGCTATLAPSQQIIAAITWKGQPGLAVIDPNASTVLVLGMGCEVLASAEQPSTAPTESSVPTLSTETPLPTATAPAP